MNDTLKTTLAQPPSHKWLIAVLVLAFLTALTHSLLLALLAGLVIGALGGSYRARREALSTWEEAREIEYRECVEELGTPPLWARGR